MSSLISFTGMASGMDTGSIVSALVQAESVPIRKMETTKSELTTKSSKLNEISGLLNSLKSAAEELNSLQKVQAATASTNQEEAVAVTTSGAAVPGQYKIQIAADPADSNSTGIATAQRNYSAGFDSRFGSLFANDGSLSITVGSNEQVDVAVKAGASLEDLASAINTSGADVTAGVMYDGTEYRLMITGNQTGKTEGQVSLAWGAGDSIDLADSVRASTSVQFTVDGMSWTSESNTVKDAIPGVTLDLLAVTDGEATISVERDTGALAEKMTSFVDAYNAAIGKVNTELSTRNQNNSAASLFGDSTLRSIRQKIEKSLLDAVGGVSGNVTTARSVGLSLDRDGVLSFDRAKFDDAAETELASIAALFQENASTGTQGIMARMGSMLESITDAKDGLIANRIDGIDDRKRSLDDQISRAQLRLDDYELRLQTQFASMEQLVSGYQAQGAQLQAILGGF